MSKVIVVGGGAAGMMAAVAAAENGHNVTLLERNEKLGKKVFITGKGRCNLTNASDMEQIFASIVTNPKFLYSALYGFDNSMCMEFFEKNGLKLKTERGNRVFPLSDHSSDVIKTMEKRYLAYTPMPNDLIDGSGFVKSSSRGKYKRKTERRIIAIIMQANVFIPSVLEKISIMRPIKKEKVNTQLVDNVIGSLIIKYINTMGMATLNRHKLLNIITCVNIIIINRKKKWIIVLLIELNWRFLKILQLN